MAVQVGEVLIEQKGREQEVMWVLAIDLEEHDPLFVLADDGRVYFVVRGESDLCGVEFYGFAHFLGLAVQLYCRNMDDILVLVFVDEVAVVGISDEVHIDVTGRA